MLQDSLSASTHILVHLTDDSLLIWDTITLVNFAKRDRSTYTYREFTKSKSKAVQHITESIKFKCPKVDVDTYKYIYSIDESIKTTHIANVHYYTGTLEDALKEIGMKLTTIKEWRLKRASKPAKKINPIEILPVSPSLKGLKPTSNKDYETDISYYTRFGFTAAICDKLNCNKHGNIETRPLRYATPISKPTYYKNGTNIESYCIDENTFYYFRKPETVCKILDDAYNSALGMKASPSKIASKVYYPLIRESFTLFVCNVKSGIYRWSDLNANSLMYCASSIVMWSNAYKNVEWSSNCRAYLFYFKRALQKLSEKFLKNPKSVFKSYFILNEESRWRYPKSFSREDIKDFRKHNEVKNNHTESFLNKKQGKIEKIKELLESGMKKKDIADSLNMSLPTLRAMLKTIEDSKEFYSVGLNKEIEEPIETVDCCGLEVETWRSQHNRMIRELGRISDFSSREGFKPKSKALFCIHNQSRTKEALVLKSGVLVEDHSISRCSVDS